MATNLVIAALLLGVLCLSSRASGVCLPTPIDCPFEELNNLMESATYPTNVKKSLDLIKEFAAKNTGTADRARAQASELARELAKLDVYNMCAADGLASLRRAVEMIQAENCGKNAQILMNAINDYAQRAVELCFDEAERKWNYQTHEHFKQDYPAFKHFDHLTITLDPKSNTVKGFKVDWQSAAELIESGKNWLKGKKSANVIEAVVEQLLNWTRHSYPSPKGEKKGRRERIEAEFENIFIGPCKEFSKQRETIEILRPLLDLSLASDPAGNPSMRQVASWTGRLMYCEGFLAAETKLG